MTDKASGLLLHPSIGEVVDESVTIQGHAIRFAAVDLAATADVIREQLLRVVAPTEQVIPKQEPSISFKGTVCEQSP